jgi:hypothetical protein
MKIVEANNPDFLCFQEVTDAFMNILMKKKFIQDHYYISGNTIV